MFVLETKDLTKIFGSKIALDGVCLAVEAGQIFALLGPNGSGKSTLVNILTGIYQPTAGESKILGMEFSNNSQIIKQMIGVLPETLGLFQGLTIWEHLMFSGDVYGVSKKESKYRSEQLLRYLDLWNSRFTKVEESSFGMKKKCSLAMALIHNPKLVFSDEPFEGIDPISANSIKNLFSLLAKNGSTVFMTSHIIPMIEKLANSFAILSEGKIKCQMNLVDVQKQNSSLEEIYFSHVENNLTGDFKWVGQ